MIVYAIVRVEIPEKAVRQLKRTAQNAVFSVSDKLCLMGNISLQPRENGETFPVKSEIITMYCG